jgi:hypothetical protein
MLTFFKNLCFPRSGGGGFIMELSWFDASLKVNAAIAKPITLLKAAMNQSENIHELQFQITYDRNYQTEYFTEINQETFKMKMIHQLFAATTIALIIVPSLTTIAKASPNNAAAGCEAITDPLRRGNCYSAIAAAQAQQDLVRNWTPRQHAIAKAIGELYNAYYQQTKRPLPINRTTVNRVARALRANSAEVSFIANRMQANYNAIVGLNQADATITSAQRFLDCLQTQGTGCIPNF